MFEMKPLPYAPGALGEYMSARTLEFHYGKHYKTYVDTLNKLIAGTQFDHLPLEEIIQKTYGKAEYQAIFNNAGQVYNHEMFWNSMTPNGGGAPQGRLAEKIQEAFGSFEKFKEEFKNAAITQFGSGWAWLAVDGGKLKIIKTANGDTPIARGVRPLLNLDVWEHAYYLDYQNRRADFAENFLQHLGKWPESD